MAPQMLTTPPERKKVMIGTRLEYLQNVVNQFTALGIVDKDCSALLKEVEAHIAARQADGVLG